MVFEYKAVSLQGDYIKLEPLKYSGENTPAYTFLVYPAWGVNAGSFNLISFFFCHFTAELLAYFPHIVSDEEKSFKMFSPPRPSCGHGRTRKKGEPG
jgi:hypothetical protein